MDRVQGDYMGMLATMINAMALQDALERQEVKLDYFWLFEWRLLQNLIFDDVQCAI